PRPSGACLVGANTRGRILRFGQGPSRPCREHRSRVMTISDDELRAALRELLPNRDIRDIVRRPSAYRSSFYLEEIEVHFTDGDSLVMLYKETGPLGLSADARSAKPAFLFDPTRCLKMYRSILTPDLGTPICYGVRCRPRENRYGLFLEKVQGVELY